tara:strand:- start:326 stop:538 length:213 start_codon:yes stop_codon:yes gene_type:complete
MGGGRPKIDNSVQEKQLVMQKEQLRKQEEDSRAQKEQIALENTQRLLAFRRGTVGRQSLLKTSERGVYGT